MPYLIDADYKGQIRTEVLSVIRGTDECTREEAEQTAASFITGYLEPRFDTSDGVFYDIEAWNEDSTYNENDHACIVSNDKTVLYYARRSNSGIDPAHDNGENWIRGDKRHKLIRKYMIDIVLYDLHSNLSQRQIPKLREDRFNQAVRWLEDIRDGKLQDPLLKPHRNDQGETTGSFVKWNSRKKLNWDL